MATYIFRCPNTGLNVQGWTTQEPDDSEGDVYEAVTCTACTRVHLVNVKTGKVLGADDE